MFCVKVTVFNDIGRLLMSYVLGAGLKCNISAEIIMGTLHACLNEKRKR